MGFPLGANEVRDASRSGARRLTEARFEEHLDSYERRKNSGGLFMGWGLAGLVFSVIASSAVMTAQGVGAFEGSGTLGPILIGSSYGLIAVSGGATGFGFVRWKRASDGYLETLRLQTQYYNLIR